MPIFCPAWLAGCSVAFGARPLAGVEPALTRFAGSSAMLSYSGVYAGSEELHLSGGIAKDSQNTETLTRLWSYEGVEMKERRSGGREVSSAPLSYHKS